MGKGVANVAGIDKQMYTSSSENNAVSIRKNDTIVDFLLSQNKNTLWLGKDSIDSVEKAEKYLSNNLSFDVDNESILMNKDYNGRTIFEKYIEPYFDERFMFAISCLVSGDISLKNILLMPIDGRYVFEHLEEKGLNLTINYLLIANDADACLELIERGYDKLLSYIGNPKVLACVTNSGETIFDKLLSYYIKDKYFLERIKKYLNDDFSFKEEAINLDSNDYHRFLAQVRDCSLIRSMWFTTQYISFMVKQIPQNIIYKYLMNNYMATQTFLDLLLLCGLTIPEVNNLAFEDEEIAKFYIKYGFYKVLGLADSNILLMKTDSGCILDSIYDEICSEEDSEERNSIFRNIEKQSSINRHVARIAFMHGDYIAALKNEEFLLSIDFDDNDTNLDFIIATMLEADIISLLGEIAKTGKLLSYKSKCLDNKMIIEFLMDNYYEDNDYFNIPTDTLLYMTEEGITLLEVMIRYNHSLIKHLVDSNPEYFSNIRIFTILHASGITNAALDINIDAGDMEKFLNPEHDDRTLSLNTFSLIDTFRNLMLQDDRSDIKAINMACRALEEEFKNNPHYASRDLESLINIKKDNPNFSLRIIVPGKTPPDIKVATFSSRDSTVYLRETSDGSIFTHEIGHVIHYYSCGYAVSDDFFKYTDRNNLPTDKIRRFAIDLYKKNQDIKQQLCEEHYPKADHEMAKKYYDGYLKRVQADLMNATNDIEYPKEYVEYLSESILSFEEFSLYFDTVLKWEYIFLKRDMVLNCELYLEDIFDALSSGKFFSEGTDDDINYFITGHGCSYYLDDYDCSLAFTEILAQYITIVKSPKAKELLGTLSDIMGREFVDMLDEFYNNMYVEGKKQLKGVA